MPFFPVSRLEIFAVSPNTLERPGAGSARYRVLEPPSAATAASAAAASGLRYLMADAELCRFMSHTALRQGSRKDGHGAPRYQNRRRHV